MSFGAALLVAHELAVPGVPGFNAIVPDQPSGRRWFVIYPDRATFRSAELCHPGQQGLLRWTVNCFAPTADEAEWVASRIAVYFQSAWVSVPGWADASVEQELSVQARSDEDVREKPLVICSDLYSMTITKI